MKHLEHTHIILQKPFIGKSIVASYNYRNKYILWLVTRTCIINPRVRPKLNVPEERDSCHSRSQYHQTRENDIYLKVKSLSEIDFGSTITFRCKSSSCKSEIMLFMYSMPSSFNNFWSFGIGCGGKRWLHFIAVSGIRMFGRC